MTSPRPILKVGLTGGIASGKSTVAGMLAERGAYVVDADALAHAATAPGGAAYDRVVERFGRQVLDDDDRIDRDKLGRLVFGDVLARQALNQIVHPVVRAEADRRINAHAVNCPVPIGIVDAALLVETGAYRDFARLIVTRCSRRTQIERLMARDGMTAEEAEDRIAAQSPLAHKLAVADYIIDTETTLEETRHQTATVYSELVDDYRAEFGQ